MELTDGTLLGGRIRYQQPRAGYRTGIEPVLMAASVPARPGMRVLEGGTGAGAALLCLLARVPGTNATGVERDPALADVARANLSANVMPTGCVHAGDLLELPAMPPFDHVMANPPWHDPGGPASPDGQRDAAKRATPRLLLQWSAASAKRVRQGGSVIFVLPAAAVADALDALTVSCCGSPSILPLWPRAGQEARLVLIRGIKDGRGPTRILPGLVLHEGAGFSAAARRILWDGAALPWE